MNSDEARVSRVTTLCRIDRMGGDYLCITDCTVSPFLGDLSAITDHP